MSEAIPTPEPVETHLAAIARAQQLLDWWDAFDSAWDALEEQGVVQGYYDPDYRLAAVTARTEGVPACQAALRQSILSSVGAGPAESITAASLQARRERQQRQTGDQDHGE